MSRKRLAPLLKRRHLSVLPLNLLSKKFNMSRKVQQRLHVSRVRQPIITHTNTVNKDLKDSMTSYFTEVNSVFEIFPGITNILLFFWGH